MQVHATINQHSVEHRIDLPGTLEKRRTVINILRGWQAYLANFGFKLAAIGLKSRGVDCFKSRCAMPVK